VEGTEIRSVEVGVAREGRRSPSVLRTYTRPAHSRQTGILPLRLERPFELRLVSWEGKQKRRSGRCSVDATGSRAYHDGSRDPISLESLSFGSALAP
jgi:hypothetical protein